MPVPAARVLPWLWGAAYLLLTLTAVFWAGNAVVGRGARELIPPVSLSFWRWAIAFCLILPLAAPHLRRDLPALVRAWPDILVLGALGIGAFNTLLYTGLQTTTALNSILLQSAQPGFVLLFGLLIFRDQVSWREVLGAMVALAGALVIVSAGELGMLLRLRLNLGDALITVAVVLWALYSVLLRRRPAVHPLSFLAATVGVGVCCVAPFYAAELLAGEQITPAPESWLAIAYVAVFPSVLAYLFFNRAVELVGSAAVGQYLNIMPVVGAVLAMVFLGERLQLYHLAGAALIGAGIVLATFRVRRPAP